MLDTGVLITALAMYAALTLSTIGNASIWFDEAFSAYIIRFDFFDIARYTAADVHPPLYYWLLKTWGMIFGNTEVALRSLSVVFGAAAITFAYLLTLRWFGRRAAWVSLLFLVLSPVLIKFGMEMRMYTLAAAFAAAATYVLNHAIEKDRLKIWIVYGVLVGLGMWTHYFTALIWLTHWAWRFVHIRSKGARGKRLLRAFFSKQWIIAHVVAVGLFLPWLPFLATQLITVQANGFWIPPVGIGTFTDYLINSFYYMNKEMIGPWLSLVFWIITLGVTVLAVKTYQWLDVSGRDRYRLILYLSFIPPVLLFLASMPPLRSSFVDRYLVTAGVFTLLVIGVTLALSKAKLGVRLLLSGLLVGVMVYGISNVYYYGTYNKTTNQANTTRQVIDLIRQDSTASQTPPIIAESTWLYYEAVFYEKPASRVYFIDPGEYKFGSLAMLKDNPTNKITDLEQFSKTYPEVWYIGRPGTSELKTPDASWTKIRSIRYDDTIRHEPLYEAILYKTNAG